MWPGVCEALPKQCLMKKRKNMACTLRENIKMTSIGFITTTTFPDTTENAIA